MIIMKASDLAIMETEHREAIVMKSWGAEGPGGQDAQVPPLLGGLVAWPQLAFRL